MIHPPWGESDPRSPLSRGQVCEDKFLYSRHNVCHVQPHDGGQELFNIHNDLSNDRA